MDMKKAWRSLGAGLMLAGAATFAQAVPLTMDLDFEGFSKGYKSGTITDDGSSMSVRAGMFQFDVSNVSGSSSFSISSNDVLEAFCVDIDTYLDTENIVSYTLLGAGDYFGDAGKVDRIGRLYTGYESAVTDAKSSAAFQLALWEIINEDSASMNLYNDGTFKSSWFDSARGLANGWLGSLDSLQNGYSLYVLSSATDEQQRKLSQDLLVFSPKPPVLVPEPGTLALLALGIVGLILRKASRRSRD
ncbi:PEP-CTERM protein-sorting domain-containing protein [Marinobacter gudaonensis]|uniref:PEP-CTERM protein-sorting domain-containing protein n=2 Tax=Marinobacter gudaonensis TaxID=375760 RepID=A0A1I6GDB7_9GAMM|nr:PEP-CTERM protein-sorting domain-containing protein [Marinobacter gudaonensis]